MREISSFDISDSDTQLVIEDHTQEPACTTAKVAAKTALGQEMNWPAADG